MSKNQHTEDRAHADTIVNAASPTQYKIMHHLLQASLTTKLNKSRTRYNQVNIQCTVSWYEYRMPILS